MEYAAMSFVCLALGLVIGFEWGQRKRESRTMDAPLPDYDPNNWINTKGHRGEKVIVCGHEFTRMN